MLPLDVEKNPLKALSFEARCDALVNHKAEKISAKQLFSLEDNYTESELKKAYRSLALYFHPDKNPEFNKKAEQAFQVVASAKEYLDYLLLDKVEQNKVTDIIKDNPFYESLDTNSFEPPKPAAPQRANPQPHPHKTTFTSRPSAQTNNDPINTFDDFLNLAKRNSILASHMVNTKSDLLVSLLRDFKQFLSYANIDSFNAGRFIDKAPIQIADSLNDFNDFKAYAEVDRYHAGMFMDKAWKKISVSLNDFKDFKAYAEVDRYHAGRFIDKAWKKIGVSLNDFKDFIAYADIDSFSAGRFIDNASISIVKSLSDYKDFLAYVKLDGFNAGKLIDKATKELSSFFSSAESLAQLRQVNSYCAVKLESYQNKTTSRKIHSSPVFSSSSNALFLAETKAELDKIKREQEAFMASHSSLFSTTPASNTSRALEPQESKPDDGINLKMGLIGLGLLAIGAVCVGLALLVIDSVILLLGGFLCGVVGAGMIKAATPQV